MTDKRREEIDKLATAISVVNIEMTIKGCTTLATFLVDAGFGSSERFEIVKSSDTEWNRKTGGILKSLKILPIQYPTEKTNEVEK